MITLHNHTQNNIIFCAGEQLKEVMRISADGITVNPEFNLDEAAQHVINAIGIYIGRMISAEREACAKVCEECNWYDRHEAAAAIRARSEAKPV